MANEIYVLNSKLDTLAIFKVYDEVIWNPKWNEPGTFQAQFLFTKESNDVLEIENLIYKADAGEAGIITRKKIDIKEDGHEYIRVDGYMVSRYLNRRIIWSKMTMTGTHEELMRKMVTEQVISPADEKRRIPNIVLGAESGYPGKTIEKQITYDNLSDALTDLSIDSELGYRLRLDLKEKLFYFEVMRGKDRTSTSADPCFFSRSFKNILKQNYEDNNNNYRNVCLVGGKGEDTDRILKTTGSASGIDRYEMFYNASGLSDKDLSSDQYLEQLGQKGDEQLAKNYRVRSFKATINTAKSLNYELGDYVTCVDPSWNIQLNAQITEIENDLSKDENSIVLTFGNSAPTLTQKIKNALF